MSLFAFQSPMKQFIFFLSFVFLCTVLPSGCDLAKPKNQEQGVSSVVQNGESNPPNPQQNPPKERIKGEDDTVTVRAQPGVGVQGASLAPYTGNNPMEIITVPLRQVFNAREMIEFDKEKHAVNLFKGMHERAPASHEEYMKEIIEANRIKLPQLRTGWEYFYDAETETLMVKRPK